ncbi:MAG TPA: sodium:proton antiporter [candidate division Zixibacteria bacterium]|nr:sodium:proton antiporter [candidate division Zixibacteria bacterium]
MVEPFMIMDQIIIILLAGVVAAKISERFGVPSIIPLFIIGYLVGPEGLGIFVPLSLGLSLSAVVTLAIPVILFDEGMRIDLNLLNEFKLTIFLLATLAVVVSTVGVGIVAHLVFGTPLLTAFLMGAILAATSPVAAIAITQQLKIERKISTIVEAEASFNDATSIVLFTIISGAVLGAGLSFSGAVFSFLVLFFGGLLAGSSLSLLVVFFIRKFNMQEYAVALSFVGFFGAYAVAEVLGASGATAVIASGLVLGGTLKRPVYGVTQGKVLDFWSNISFLARSIIFLVLGAGFSLVALSSVWLEATVLILLLFLVIRPISVFSATYFEKKLSNKEKLFISWVGTRGAVPAALAASAIGLGIAGADKIFSVVIIVVLASLVIVGFLGRKMARFTLTNPSTSEKQK